MIKIESATLEEAYKDAASSLECSVMQLKIEVVQYPSKGFLGLFKKNAIIVATKQAENLKEVKEVQKEKEVQKVEKVKEEQEIKKEQELKGFQEVKKEIKTAPKEKKSKDNFKEANQETNAKKYTDKKSSHTILNNTIMPASFVSTQDEEDDEIYVNMNFTADYDDEFDNQEETKISEIAKIVKKDINNLFDLTCFDIDEIEVSVYDENTLLVEFKGEDAALLIGKEGYRYKALSYIIFNWINTKYQLQLRLEIAEFLKNQEEAVSRYLVGVCEGINRDGRAQTKILDGVLVQIALKELREKYPEKYVVIRSTRDGLKYIIVNDYHTN